MKRLLKRNTGLLMAVLIAVTACFGCGLIGPSDPPDQTTLESETEPSSVEESKEPDVDPNSRLAFFHASNAVGPEDAKIDVSSVSEGYVAVMAKSDMRLKFQVKNGESTYNYDLSSEGVPSVFPLQFGNGVYTFRIMENVEKKSYAEKYSVTCEVTLRNEFVPFLVNSDYVDFGPDSYSTETARALSSGAETPLESISRIYEYVCLNIQYDREKARNVNSGYMPDPDETLRTGKGICFDYAALTAAMLRSLGIPTKMVFGYVAPKGLYHAWNMFYTEETGWITVTFEVKGGDWSRIDLTFSAGGADPDFIGDGTNYSDLYYY